jgi:hypothetical protein
MACNRNRRKRLLIAAAACGGVILAGIHALWRTPDWYALPEIPPQQRQSVRNNLVAAEQAMTESLLTAEAPFVYQLYQDDVNRWIAMRREIYPLIDELAPPELIDPIILFEPGEITLAGRYRLGAMNVVLSVDLAATFEQDHIRLQLKTIRCGSMRIPVGLVRLDLRQVIDRPRDALWPGSPRIHGNFLTGLFIDARAWWKNGGVAYRVLGVELTPGRLALTIQPLGRHVDKHRRDQD